MSALSISRRNDGDKTVLDLEGKILLGEESAELRDAILQLVNAGRKTILLNLGGVTAIDSSGLGTLVACFATTRREGVKLALFGLTDKISDIMAVTKLATVFDLYPDEMAANAAA